VPAVTWISAYSSRDEGDAAIAREYGVARAKDLARQFGALPERATRGPMTDLSLKKFGRRREDHYDVTAGGGSR
jgi:hypothetical protein